MRTEDTPDRIKYIQDLFAPQDSVLQSIDNKIKLKEFPIHIGAEEGKFLQFLIKSLGVKSIVEVGTLAAYSTIWMARALPENGKIYTIERSAPRIELAKESIATLEKDTKDKIKLITGDARKVLGELEGEFDMIFIDADKISYLAYLDWAEKHIKKGGLIVGDNTFLFDAVYKDAPNEGISNTAFIVMKEFNQRLADSSKYTGIMLPTKEGMTIARKEF